MAVSLRIPLIAAAALLGLLATEGLRVAARAQAPSAVDLTLAVPALPASVVRHLSFGFQSASADVSFLAAIQIFGAPAYIGNSPESRVQQSLALHRLLEYATDLDPGFEYAYVFGAVAIPIILPDGARLNVREAIDLLEKGVAKGGKDWRVPLHLAYLYSSVFGDFERAAAAMSEAARRPRRPDYVPLLAIRLAAAGGSIETGLSFTRAMLANTESDEQRDELEKRILLLEMERDLRAIEEAAAAFRLREKRLPATVEELQASGFLATLPPEPHGGRYLFDSLAGVARSTGAERLKLPERVVEEIERTRRANQAAKPAVAETTTP